VGFHQATKTQLAEVLGDSRPRHAGHLSQLGDVTGGLGESGEQAQAGWIGHQSQHVRGRPGLLLVA